MLIRSAVISLMFVVLILNAACDFRNEAKRVVTAIREGNDKAVAVDTQLVTGQAGKFTVTVSAPELVKGSVSLSSDFSIPIRIEVKGPAQSAIFISTDEPSIASGCTKIKTPAMKHLLDVNGSAVAEGRIHYAAIIDCTIRIEVLASDTYGRGDPDFDAFGLWDQIKIPIEITIPHDIPADHPELLKRKARQQCELAGKNIVGTDREVKSFSWNYKSVKEVGFGSYQVKGSIITSGTSSTNMLFRIVCAVTRKGEEQWEINSSSIEGWDNYLRETEEYLRKRKKGG